MKTLKNKLLLGLIVVSVLGFQACKKKNSDDFLDDSAVQIQHSSDEAGVTNETESSLDDVNVTMGASSLGKGFTIAGATVDSIVADKMYIINYNGNNANGTRFRSGQIVVQLTSGSKWRDVNAIVTITFNNLLVRNNSTNKSIILNGTHMVSNLNGGLVSMLIAGGTSVVHKITGNMIVTFEDSTQRTWAVYRQREILISATGIPTIKVSGFGSIDGVSNIVVAGTNRSGNPFNTIITQTLVFTKNSGCFNGSWVPVSGIKTHKKIAREITVTFGVDQSGAVVSSVCPYGYKVVWTNLRNDSKQAIISY
jgi:hypothetical protein